MSDDKATCRHCGKQLIGKAYHLGGAAYLTGRDGRIGKRAPVNYYGGFVCSRSCDYGAALALEESMPGHGGQRSLTPGPALRRIESNWDTP